MKLLDFLSAMTEAFNGEHQQRSSVPGCLFVPHRPRSISLYERLSTRTHDPERLSLTWLFILHSLLSRFITYDLLRYDHYAVISARIKQSEKEMDFAKRIHEMAPRCRNVL